MLEITMDKDLQIVPILDTFERNMFGEVAAGDLINAIKTAHTGDTDEAEKVLEENQPVVECNRYFAGALDVMKEVCTEIDDRNLADFGSFLKGNDLFHEGKISNANFFQILKNMFSDLLGEGDILDLIRYFDPEQTGTTNIQKIAADFNQHIVNRKNQIKLVSWVDACVEENIVEPVSPRSKASR